MRYLYGRFCSQRQGKKATMQTSISRAVHYRMVKIGKNKNWNLQISKFEKNINISFFNFCFNVINLFKHGTCPVCRKNLNGEDTSQREYVSRPPPNQQNNNNNSNNNNASASASSAAADASDTSTSSGTGGGTGQRQPPSGSNESNSRSSNSRNDFYDPDFD